MKIKDEYKSEYFRNLNDEQKDKITYKSIISAKEGDREKWIGIINTLYFFGNSIDEIVGYILKYNTCGFHDEVITTKMVGILLCSKGNGKLYTSKKCSKKEAGGSVLSFVDSLAYLQYFLQHFALPREDIPATAKEAAKYHISRGRIPLPRYKDTKQVYLPHRRPGKTRFQWKNGGTDYSKKIMTEQDIYGAWDFDDGLCLIVPQDWRDDVYLDIDMRSPAHPQGLEKLDESILKGYSVEKTPSGGYHVFGRGRPQKPPIPAEIAIASTLIVTYPSNGYILL